MWRKKRFRRRYKQRRRYGKKKGSWRRRPRIYKSVVEKKSIESYLNVYYSSIGSTTWTEQTLANIVQGMDINARIGRKISVLGVYLDGLLQGGFSGGAADDAYNVVRILLTTCRGLTAAPMQTMGATLDCPIKAKGRAEALEPINDRDILRSVLYDKQYILNAKMVDTDGTGYVGGPRRVRISHTFKRPLSVTWGTSGTNSPSVSLWLSMLSDSTIAPSPGFIYGTLKVIFVDS